MIESVNRNEETTVYYTDTITVYVTTLFEEAKQLLDSLFPQYNFIEAGESITIELDIATYKIFDSMSLSAEFGSAESFSSFDATTGDIVISPSLTDLGVFNIMIILTDGLKEGKSIM